MQTPLRQFSLSQDVASKDIKQLAHIHVEALRDDASAAVKFTSLEEFRGKVEDMLRGQLGIKSGFPQVPKTGAVSSRVNDWFFVKATLKVSNSDEDESEPIIGWASWLHEDPGEGEPDGKAMLQQPHQAEKAVQANRKLMEFNQGLGTFVRGRQRQVYKNWWKKRVLERDHVSSSDMVRAPGFFSLRSCFVLPEFQGRGIGGALVRLGCGRADQLMMDCLVTSTPSAKGLYASVGGFEVLEWLDVDLGEWEMKDEEDVSRNSAGSEAAPSIYQFWFMARTCRQKE